MKPKVSPSISIVIPAYNESKTIKKVVFAAQRVAKKLTSKFEIIVLDDCSTDKTLTILKKIKVPQLRILRHKRNKGIEKSLRDLYAAARNKLIFFNGADGDIDMAVLKKLFHVMKKRKADLVVGNRVFKNYTLKRRIVSTLYNNLVWILTGVRVYDAGTVKLVKSSKYAKEVTKSKSVFAEAERLVRSVRRGAKIVKADIHQNQNKMNDKVSIFQLLWCLQDLLRLGVEIRFNKLRK